MKKLVLNFKMNIYEVLDKYQISYQEVTHPKVMTVDEMKKLSIPLKGVGCKNLFLTDHKGKYFLVVLEENKRADLKYLRKFLHVSSLSFASADDLREILHLEVGSVTPLGIIHDVKKQVLLLIDKELEDQILLVHPDTNTKTLAISYADLVKCLEIEGHDYVLL